MGKPLVAVLAAGRGTRFGGGKLEAICAGKPLGRWALDAVAEAGLEPGIVITGPAAVGFATPVLPGTASEGRPGRPGRGLNICARRAATTDAGTA